MSLSEIIIYVNNLKLENASRSTNKTLQTFKNNPSTMYFRPFVNQFLNTMFAITALMMDDILATTVS